MCRPPPTSTLFPYTTLFRSLSPMPTALRVHDSSSHQRIRIDKYHAIDSDWDEHAKTQKIAQPHVARADRVRGFRSEEHTSELQSHSDLVCRLLLEKKKKKKN